MQLRVPPQGLEVAGWDRTGWDGKRRRSGVRIFWHRRSDLEAGAGSCFWPPGCVQLDGGGGGGVLSDGFVGWERYVSSRGDLGQAFLDAFFDT